MIKIRQGDDLRRLSRDLRREADGKALRRGFVKEVRKEVQPIQAAVKAAYRSAPSKGGPRPHGSLRSKLAKATTTEVRLTGRRAGVTLRVAGKKMPSGEGRLPKLYEGEAPWRHPAFDTDTWVQQQPNPTFVRIVPRAARVVRRGVDRLAQDLVRRLSG
jgi:hypothetical protein